MNAIRGNGSSMVGIIEWKARRTRPLHNRRRVPRMGKSSETVQSRLNVGISAWSFSHESNIVAISACGNGEDWHFGWDMGHFPNGFKNIFFGSCILEKGGVL